MLIKSYGINWNPFVIDWVPSGTVQMTGEVRKEDGTIVPINFYNAKGIYVLQNEFKPIYAGKAFGTPLGQRLRDHLSDRLAGRWDMFSWYSVSSPRFTQKDVSQPGGRHMEPERIVEALEALAILIADPPLNRKRESLKDAYEATQPENIKPRTIRAYLEDIISKLPPPSLPTAVVASPVSKVTP